MIFLVNKKYIKIDKIIFWDGTLVMQYSYIDVNVTLILHNLYVIILLLIKYNKHLIYNVNNIINYLFNNILNILNSMNYKNSNLL